MFCIVLGFRFLFIDSGMSVSFQSGSAGSAGTVSQESSPQQQLSTVIKTGNIHSSQLQNLNRGRKLSSGIHSLNWIKNPLFD